MIDIIGDKSRFAIGGSILLHADILGSINWFINLKSYRIKYTSHLEESNTIKNHEKNNEYSVSIINYVS